MDSVEAALEHVKRMEEVYDRAAAQRRDAYDLLDKCKTEADFVSGNTFTCIGCGTTRARNDQCGTAGVCKDCNNFMVDSVYYHLPDLIRTSLRMEDSRDLSTDERMFSTSGKNRQGDCYEYTILVKRIPAEVK